MKVIIAGGREFNDYDLLTKSVDRILSNVSKDMPIIIVSGCATGADRLGEIYALEHNYDIERHPANWEVYGPKAGPIRNAEMADCSDALIAFWDGWSRGTKNMIKEAEARGLKIRVVEYKK